ncbi:hypothetical protein NHQ30_008538 [Ciborinia camelliae]|nr:hypothetical protein NHQ30_008538 [Ciborinia camelliae]
MEGGRPPPQLPFSRNTNTASPYGRSSFPPAPNGQASQYPSPSHPPNGPPYADHQRRTSDGQYFQHRFQEGPQGPPMHGGGHSRHPSSSSIGHGTPVGRGMPPPSSPQQQQHQGPHGYGPPHPRAPPVSVGPPAGFPGGRELPPPPLNRPPSTAGSSMSISSMLGGPTPVSREQMPPQYTSPIGTSAPPPLYGSAPHASPRVGSAINEYPSFGRPRTPEQRYEHQDHRANSAGSPAGAGQYGTPDHRHGTPQQYSQRPPQNPMIQHPEDRRDSQVLRNNNMGMAPRPNSQPMAYNPPISRPADRPPNHGESQFGRRGDYDPRAMETLNRGEPFHQRPPGFNNRHDPAFEFMERERERERDREVYIQRERLAVEREREREREQALAMHEQARTGMIAEYPHQMPQRNQAPPPVYGRQPDVREQAAWMRPGYDQQRHPFEPQQYERPPPSHAQHGNGYDYPRSAAPQYQNHPNYDPVPPHDQRDPRYPPVSHPQPHSQQAPGPGPHFETPYEERLTRGPHQQQPQHAARQQVIEAQARAMQPQQLPYSGPPNPQYQQHESPQRRPVEEAPQMMQQQSQRSFLGVQDNRRGGRISPIPQAVQGAQVQQPGPAGEPGIKSEFGKIFHGIGSGVGATMSMPSPVAGSAATGLSLSGPRREDLDSPSAHNSPIENGGSIMTRPLGRRRKLKEEDRGDDESSTGRQTPNGKGKRTKHAAHRHHHHHRPDALDRIPSPSSQSLTPFKSVKSTNGNASPPNGERLVVPHHHIQRHHHHHHSAGPKVASPMNTIIRMPRYEVKSQAIIEAASAHPRAHLGHEYYQPNLKLYRSSSSDRLPYNRGFASTNRAFPNFEGKVNCTYTIKVSRTHLKPKSREEITYRKNVWGTDVYSDDSDVVAACIHQGWFCGKWAKDVDVKLLNLYPSDEGISVEPELDILVDGPDEFFDRPPARGPMPVRSNRDLHVTVLVLDCLDKYSSKVRFGIKSREWGGDHTTAHDGLSYLIMNIKWVDGVDGKESGNVAEKSFMRMQHQEISLDRQQQEAEHNREMWLEKKMNGNGKRAIGHGDGEDIRMEESHMRGDESGQNIFHNGEIRGIGMGSWWKGTPRDSSRHSDNGEIPGAQEDQEMTGIDTLPSKAHLSQAHTDSERDASMPLNAKNLNSANFSGYPESMSEPSKRRQQESQEHRNTVDSTLVRSPLNVPESMVLDAPAQQVMQMATSETGKLPVQPTQTASNHQEIETSTEANQKISEAETETPAAQKQNEKIAVHKENITDSKDQESLPQIVPAVEAPATAPETQPQTQGLHLTSTIVEEGAAVDADSSASASVEWVLISEQQFSESRFFEKMPTFYVIREQERPSSSVTNRNRTSADSSPFLPLQGTISKKATKISGDRLLQNIRQPETGMTSECCSSCSSFGDMTKLTPLWIAAEVDKTFLKNCILLAPIKVKTYIVYFQVHNLSPTISSSLLEISVHLHNHWTKDLNEDTVMAIHMDKSRNRIITLRDINHPIDSKVTITLRPHNLSTCPVHKVWSFR